MNGLGNGVALWPAAQPGVGDSASSPARPAFWDKLEAEGARVALLSPLCGQVSYRELAALADKFADTLPTRRKLLIQVTALNSVDTIASYLGALRAGHAVLVAPAAPAMVGHENVTQTYRPDILVGSHDQLTTFGPNHAVLREFDEAICLIAEPNERTIHPDLALLLSTSGSTGNPKAVRLSARNVRGNAQQIVQALDMGGDDRGVSSLPGHFIYGLSVLNSHLATGGSYVLSSKSLFDQSFWREADELAITTYAGVPYTFKALRQLGLKRAPIARFRKVCHSGGFLDKDTSIWFSQQFIPPRAAVYFMYGQTEAAGRMAVLPPELAVEKPGAVGLAVPGGRLDIDEDGQIVFTGPNVMMGYATDQSGLARGDECQGVLPTGDLGEIDQDGILRITGRLVRIVKIMGKRINLDEIETHWQSEGDLAVNGNDDRIDVFVEGHTSETLKALINGTLKSIGLPLNTVKVHNVDEIPRASSGKVYRTQLSAGI